MENLNIRCFKSRQQEQSRTVRGKTQHNGPPSSIFAPHAIFNLLETLGFT